MRQIKFRGKSIRTGQWVQGMLIQNNLGSYIVIEKNPHECTQYGYITIEVYERVYPESIGQSTGCKDKNDQEIVEGDLTWDSYREVVGKIIFDEGRYSYEWGNISEDLFEVCDEIEIIGNIYEDSHLLEGATNER